MALENLTPSNRLEEILDGGEVTPSNRKEYFIQKAMSSGSGLPSYSSSDIGKVLSVVRGEGQSLDPEDFIPTQALNFEDGGALLTEINVNQETFQSVTQAEYIADGGVSYTLSPHTRPDGSFYLSNSGGEVQIGYVPRFDGWMVVDSTLSDGSHTIAVSATIAGQLELKWVSAN